jgi:hypothetical protein
MTDQIDDLGAGEHADRVLRSALLRAWHVLTVSVARGRPITLPNLLRFFRRSLAAMRPAPNAERSAAAAELLRRAYLSNQPFTTCFRDLHVALLGDNRRRQQG